MSAPRAKCTRCARLTDKPKFTTKDDLTTWHKICSNHSQERTPTTSIDTFYKDIHGEVNKARREAERSDALLQREVEVQAIVDLPISTENFGWQAVKDHFKPFAVEIADTVRSKTEWAFTYHQFKMTGTGPRYLFRCSQDLRNSRQRNGKNSREGGPTKSSCKADRFECQGELAVNIDVGGGFARLRFIHHYHHFAYKHVKLPKFIEKEALRLLGDGVSKPSTLFQTLMGKLEKDDQNLVTQNQIRGLVTRERNRKLGVDPKLLSQAKTMGEQINLIMPTVEKLKLWDATDDQVWESFVWTIEPFNEIVEHAVEILFDGTHGTTIQDFEVVVCLGEKRAHAYPVALLALRPSKSRASKSNPTGAKVTAQSRLDVIESFFETIRSQQFAEPSTVHVDKDFSEISAIRRVWRHSSIHICLWHMKKAVERGLANPLTVKGTRYDPQEVSIFLPSIDRNFLPLNPKKPKRVYVDPYREPTPAPIPSSPSPILPSPPPIPPLSPLSRFHAMLGSFVPTYSAPATLSDEEAAERRRLEYDDEEEEEPWVDSFEEMNAGLADLDEDDDEDDQMTATNISVPVQEEELVTTVRNLTAEERRNASQKKFREEPLFPRALSDVRKKISELMGVHSFRHPSIPTPRGSLEPREHYLECLEEMYKLCYEQELGDAWAYLWENWYRPGRWELWTRSSCEFMPVLRTTMGAEAFFRALKNDWMGRRRTSLVALIQLIEVDVIRHYEQNLDRFEHGDLTQNFRLARSRWRYDFKEEERRVFQKEYARRAQTSASQNDNQDPSQATTSRAQPIHAPPFLPPICATPPHAPSEPEPEPESDWYIDPVLLALDPPTRPSSKPVPLRTKHFFDPIRQVCSCPSFLRSRFLRCKHIILSTKHEVLGDGTREDEDLWFEVVERYREPPFWRIPEAAKKVATRRKKGLETTKEMWDSIRLSERESFDPDNDDDDDIRGSSVWRIGDHSDDEEEPLRESRVETLEAGSEASCSSAVGNLSKRARSVSEELDDYSSQESDRSRFYDDAIRSLAGINSFLDQRKASGGDPRALKRYGQELEKLRKKWEKEGQEQIGSGGLAGGRSTKKSDMRTVGKENLGAKKKRRKSTQSRSSSLVFF